jgi:hypothetical protein
MRHFFSWSLVSRARKDWLMWSSRGMAVTSMKPSGVEVMAKATRRKFSAEYKLAVVVAVIELEV